MSPNEQGSKTVSEYQIVEIGRAWKQTRCCSSRRQSTNEPLCFDGADLNSAEVPELGDKGEELKREGLLET